MIKLLALDLDGTLLNSRGKISKENKQAIRKAEEKGVLVTIATGRRFRDARPVALEIGFNAPIVTHNGALLKFAESLETVEFSLLSNETVFEILRAGKLTGGDALVSVDPHGHDAEESVRHVANLEDIVEKTEIVHISFSGACEPMCEMQQILTGELQDSVNILATVYPRLDFTLLDILP